jgi:hypothetical protein
VTEWPKVHDWKCAEALEGEAEKPSPAEKQPDRETAVPRSEPITEATGESGGNESTADVVEVALADAVTKASAAGAWQAVAALTAELRARREARAGVRQLDSARRKGQR